MSLAQRLEARLAEIRTAGLTRVLRPPAGIDLTSNDYLGLAQHPFLKQRMAEAVLREGCGSTGSRLLRGEREAFSHVEAKFAHFKGADRALYFSSGYLANLAVLTTFPEPEDTIFSDEQNHASLIDGIRLSRAQKRVFPHNDVAALRGMLESAARENPDGQRFVVTESLFSMDGDEAPLREYAQVCAEHGAALIVDEAHAVGIYGASGSGLMEEIGISGAVFVSINTAGKAMGVSGAFVAGPELAMEYLLQRARPFIFSTAAPPAVAAAMDASLDVIAAEPERRQKLLANAALLRGELGMGGRSQIIPYIVGENERAVAVAAAMQAEGFDVRAVRPPTVPPGTARLRISVNQGLSEGDLTRFARVLRAWR